MVLVGPRHDVSAEVSGVIEFSPGLIVEVDLGACQVVEFECFLTVEFHQLSVLLFEFGNLRGVTLVADGFSGHLRVGVSRNASPVAGTELVHVSCLDSWIELCEDRGCRADAVSTDSVIHHVRNK